MNAILTMSTFIFPLITFPYISRVLLPVGTGKVSFATSLISYFSMFAQLGIPTYGIIACARVRDDKEELTRTVHELLFINIVMSLVVYVLLIVGCFTIPKLQEERVLICVISITIFLSAIGMEWLYKALEQYTYITVRSIIFKFIALIAMFLLIHDQSDYVVYGGITIFASSASNILNLFNARKYIGFKYIGNYNLRRQLKPVSIFFAMACATTIYLNLDTVMLGFMTTDSEVGYYSAAVKIKTILGSIVTSLGVTLLPRTSYYIKNGQRDEFEKIGKKALNFVCLFASPLMVYFALYAREGIFFLSGDAYEGAVLPMQIIMPTLLLIGITNIIGIQMLTPLGKEKAVLVSEIAGAVVDLVLNAIFIPVFGASGASLGTLAAESVVLIVQYSYIRKMVINIFETINIKRITTAIIISFAAAYWIKSLHLNDFIALFVSAVLFFGMYTIMMLFMKEPLVREILFQVINKIKKKVAK